MMAFSAEYLSAILLEKTGHVKQAQDKLLHLYGKAVKEEEKEYTDEPKDLAEQAFESLFGMMPTRRM